MAAMSDDRTRRLEGIYHCLQILKEETRHLHELSTLIGIAADLALLSKGEGAREENRDALP
ncbi:MAG TPA: hypothetical protein VHL08_01775 [Dongiaceae bacterium]|jgi:hypothetical protein|nr:hypothetical protein [Dongiaceae bacterium]